MTHDETQFHLLKNVYADYNSKASIKNILERIRSGGNNVERIMEARKHGKGTKAYNRIKLGLDCWLPNALCVGYPFDKSTFRNFTGYLYLDRDGLKKDQAIHLKNQLKENEYVYASWLSLSEQGLGVLIKVETENLTPENFKHNYKHIAATILGTYDKRCNSITKKNVLPYDPDLYINEGAQVYSTVKDLLIPDNSSGIHLPPNNAFNKETLLFGNIFPKEDFEQDQDWKFEEDTYANFQIWLPYAINDGERHGKLFAMLTNCIAKNGVSNMDLLWHWFTDLNDRLCKPPEDEHELKTIFMYAIDLYKEGKLTSSYARKSRMKWKEGNKLTAKEKQSITAQEMAKFKRKKTREAIQKAFQELILELAYPPTQKQVARQTGKSIETVKKYWREIDRSDGGDK